MNKWYMRNSASVQANETQIPMRLWQTYGSTNLGQKKKEHLQNCEL